MELREIKKETAVGFSVLEIIDRPDLPHPERWTGQMRSDERNTMTITLTPVFSLFTPPGTQLIDYEPGTGIMKVEGWGNRQNSTMWVADDESSTRTLSSWFEKTTLGCSTISPPPVGMWKRLTTVKTSNLTNLWDLLQESSAWESAHIVERKLTKVSETWEHSNRDAALEQGYEASGLPHHACCPNCKDKKPVVISGIRDNTAYTAPSQPMQERFLDCFCPSCWRFQDFRHNKDEVQDFSFLRKAISKCRLTDPALLSQGLRGPVKDSEMEKIADNYLKNNKAPGPDCKQYCRMEWFLRSPTAFFPQT